MASDTPTPTHGTGGNLGEVAGRSDQGKAILHTIDPKMLMAWGNVLAFGAKKYHQRNFLLAPGMEWSRVYDSLMHHLFAFWGGEWLDEESGEPHIAHAMCNLQFLWTYHEHPQYRASDDRPSSIEYEGGDWKDWKGEFDAARGLIRLDETVAYVEPIDTPKPAWLTKTMFGVWLPVKSAAGDGSWVVVYERMLKEPVIYRDPEDDKHNYKMDEDEALIVARRLNAANVVPDDDNGGFHVEPTGPSKDPDPVEWSRHRGARAYAYLKPDCAVPMLIENMQPIDIYRGVVNGAVVLKHKPFDSSSHYAMSHKYIGELVVPADPYEVIYGENTGDFAKRLLNHLKGEQNGQS